MGLIIRKMCVALIALAVLMLPALYSIPVPAYAAVEDSLCGGADDLKISSSSTTKCSSIHSQDRKLNDLVANAINLLSLIVGVVAVVMVVIAGFKYITSGGSSEKVGSAKSTLTYAIVGLVIVAMAQMLVRFVLSKAT